MEVFYMIDITFTQKDCDRKSYHPHLTKGEVPMVTIEDLQDAQNSWSFATKYLYQLQTPESQALYISFWVESVSYHKSSKIIEFAIFY